MTKPPDAMTPENKTSLVVAVILIVLIGLALWQFYALAWGDVIRSSHAIGSDGGSPAIAAFL